MTRRPWLIGLAVLFAAAVSAGVHFWRVHGPPVPAAANLPASAQVLLQPYRKDQLDLALAAHGQVQYRIAMQAGATLVYAWTSSRGSVSYQFADRNPGRASDAHGAFVAQSSGWYRWQWNNQSNDSISIHLKLSGYYEPAALPYDK